MIERIEQYLNRRGFEKAHRIAKTMAVTSEILFTALQKPDTPEIEHPLHAQRKALYISQLSTVQKQKVAINFGDSLTDLARRYLTSVDWIASISGSWSNHIAQMAREVKAALASSGKSVDCVFVGTLGGNPLLIYESLPETINRAARALDEIRSLYPDARIVVYGLPPVYNLHATRNAYSFDAALLDWVMKDRDAVFIDLHGKFGRGFLWLFPDVVWSSDGVHLTPRGATKLNKYFHRARELKFGRLI